MDHFNPVYCTQQVHNWMALMKRCSVAKITSTWQKL